MASQIESPDAQRRELESSIARELAGDDRLASYCGLAPADRQSGTSISSTSASRSGNKTLKNLLIFSRDPLVGTRSRFGRHYDERRSRGMAHNKALKAVARKRLGAIFAVMRDKVPYVEPGEGCSKPATQEMGASQKCSKRAS